VDDVGEALAGFDFEDDGLARRRARGRATGAGCGQAEAGALDLGEGALAGDFAVESAPFRIERLGGVAQGLVEGGAAAFVGVACGLGVAIGGDRGRECCVGGGGDLQVG